MRTIERDTDMTATTMTLEELFREIGRADRVMLGAHVSLENREFVFQLEISRHQANAIVEAAFSEDDIHDRMMVAVRNRTLYL